MDFKKLVCTHIETIAFDDQRVTFASADMEVTLRIKNQAHHNQYAVGDKMIKDSKKK